MIFCVERLGFAEGDGLAVARKRKATDPNLDALLLGSALAQADPRHSVAGYRLCHPAPAAAPVALAPVSTTEYPSSPLIKDRVPSIGSMHQKQSFSRRLRSGRRGARPL